MWNDAGQSGGACVFCRTPVKMYSTQDKHPYFPVETKRKLLFLLKRAIFRTSRYCFKWLTDMILWKNNLISDRTAAKKFQKHWIEAYYWSMWMTDYFKRPCCNITSTFHIELKNKTCNDPLVVLSWNVHWCQL